MVDREARFFLNQTFQVFGQFTYIHYQLSAGELYIILE